MAKNTTSTSRLPNSRYRIAETRERLREHELDFQPWQFAHIGTFWTPRSLRGLQQEDAFDRMDRFSK